MTKLLRYLRPHALPILICLALLFGQAMADLALPDRMSNIVNNGIQKGGVTSPFPEAMSAETYTRIMMFLPEESRDAVGALYSDDVSGEINKFPGLDGARGYALTETDKDALSALELDFSRAMTAHHWAKLFTENPEAAAEIAKNFNMPSSGEEGMPQMSEAERLAWFTGIINGLDPMMISQAAVQGVLAEYEALGADMSALQTGYILWAGLQMLLLSLLGAACSVLVTFFAARIAASVSAALRHDVFAKVESFSLAEFDKFSTASLITRTTNDITQIQGLIVMAIRMLIYAPIMGVGGVIYALRKSTSMSWIIALAVVILLGIIAVLVAVAMPRFQRVQKLVDRLNLVSRENLSGMMVIRAYNTQDFEEKRFDAANRDLTDNSLFINRLMSTMMPFMMLIMNGVSLLIMWVGAHQIQASALQIGDMMAFIQYAIQIVMSFLMLSMMFIMMPRAAVSGQRVAEVLGTDISVKDPQSPKTLSGLSDARRGVVEFKNVSFRFPGAEEDTLHDISFIARPGETTAFIGPTGSGKSTVVNLLPRFYDVTGGSVTLGGVDIRELTQKELRDQIGYVPQKGTLFSGTIASNFEVGRPEASREDMELAAEVAQASDFIAEKGEGFGAEISQGGSNVSGGQRQRLSIARALIKKPQVFIFDDSFSALDYKTDANLRRALKRTTGNSTQLIVAQRVGTIMHAEQIIVLNEGRIVGRGRHDELMESCGIYREIAQSQLRKGEGA